MDFVLEVTGGIGKHIMATSVVKWVNEKYPDSKIIMVSAYPEIFEYNPRIYRNLHLSLPYLYEDYIKGKDLRKGEPYSLQEYYRETEKMHLMKVYPKALMFNEYNENPETEFYLSSGEEMDGKVFNETNQPIITIQAFGGLPSGAAYSKDKLNSAQRDMKFEFATKLVYLLSSKGFKLLQIRTEQERQLPNCIQANSKSFRDMLAVSKYSVGHIGIDSSMMHGAAVFKKPMLIFWGNTHVDNLGYTYKGVINAHNEFGMHNRPVIQMHDRMGGFNFKHPNEGKEFEYTDEQLKKFIDDFCALCINTKPIITEFNKGKNIF